MAPSNDPTAADLAALAAVKNTGPSITCDATGPTMKADFSSMIRL